MKTIFLICDDYNNIEKIFETETEGIEYLNRQNYYFDNDDDVWKDKNNEKYDLYTWLYTINKLKEDND